MKLILVLMLCGLAAAAAAPKVEDPTPFEVNAQALADNPEGRSILVNTLVRQLIAYVRRVINNGMPLFGIPPLDPLVMQNYRLVIPAGIINLDLELSKVFGTGIGSFVVHRSNLNLSELSLDLDISVPTIYVSAEHYNLIGDLFTAIPIYGKGNAVFKAEAFRLQAKLYLKQSENLRSVLIDRVENARFQVPYFKSELSGAIGGGNIDGIVNSMVEEVIVDYVNRFQGAIAAAASHLVVANLNPILNQLSTWRYIAPLLPSNAQE